MRVSKYTKLGILMVFATAVLIWGLNYLKGQDIFKQSKLYYVIYERVGGLNESDQVILNGFKIGQVRDIGFLSDTNARLQVTLSIDENIKIPVNSVAQIVSSDLMGTRAVQLILSRNTEYYKTNDTIPGSVETGLREQVSQQVLPIKNKAEELLGTIDSAITILTVIFNEDARENLSKSFTNINQTIINIEETTADLREIVESEKENVKNIISSLDGITSTFNANSAQLENTIQNLSDFTDTLTKISLTPIVSDIVTISERINVILAKLENTESTAGLLLNDDNLYQSVKTLSSDLSLLINDIRINPERYVHFSAVDLGKNVYINTSDKTDNSITFKVHLVSGENKVPLDSEYFEGIENVEEYQTGSVYTYLTGKTNSYTEILDLYDEVKEKFPDASIVAFKNGRIIKLEKALKRLK